MKVPYRRFVGQLFAVMDNVPSGVMIALDSVGKALLTNRAAREILGLSDDEDTVAAMPAFLVPGSEVALRREDLPLYRALFANEAVPASEYEIVRSDRSRCFVSVSAAPLRDGAGRIYGGIAVIVDVTVLRSQNIDLRSQRDRLTRLIAQEQVVAETLCTAQLPHDLPNVPGFAFSALYQPAGSARVGGDWYDAFPLGDGRIGFSIGDVMGSGLDAAVTMGKLRQAIQSAAFVCPNPPVMLSAARSTLELHDPEKIATAIAGVLSPRKATIAFASAGHPLPFVRRGSRDVEAFDGAGPPLGTADEHALPTHCAHLDPGDVAVFYTDGLIEATRDVHIGQRILRTALVSPNPIALQETARAIHERVLGRSASFPDDVAILTVARTSS